MPVTMKILLVTESYWPNADGGALFERRLVLGLINRGHKLSVWTPGTKLSSYDEQDGAYTIHREKSVRFIVNPKYRVSYWPFLRARKLIRAERPDVIHIHNFWFLGLSAMWWAKRYRIPIIATNHFMPENALLNLRFLRPVAKPAGRMVWSYLVKLHNRCNFVTSPTQTAVNLLLKHGLTAPVEAITNGIDTNVFKPDLDTTAVQEKYRLPKDQPIILYLGRVDGEKRLDLLVSAITEVKPPAHLVIAGFGVAQKTLEQQAAKLGITDRVTFTGYIDEDDKAAIYNTATVFAISSPAELQSIVLLEAMASALPLVAVDVAALSELCRNGENGYLFTRDDWHALAAALNHLLANPRLAHRFGQASRRIVEQSHSTNYTFDRYEAAYERLVTSRSQV